MDIQERIQQQITENPVVLYMKGTPDQPQCGFSKQVLSILAHLKVEFTSDNVLADEELRVGIKQFSDWPTIPQLYVNGEFIGGCDITTEMFNNGELEAILRKAGLIAEE